MFRNEKPGPGHHSFMQFNANSVGADHGRRRRAVHARRRHDEAPRPAKVNNRKVLDGIMESISIGGGAGQRADAQD